MTDPTKRNASADTLAASQSRYDDNAKRKPQHSEFQGLGTARRGKQPAPSWSAPTGWMAADMLDALTRKWVRR